MAVEIAEPKTPYLMPGGRDLRLDLLRGYCIVRMIVDHVVGYSYLWWFIGGYHFLVTGAEGFLFISGTLAGIVYHKIMHRSGLGDAVRKVVKRCVDLYLVALANGVIFLFVSEHLHFRWSQGLTMSEPLLVVIKLITHKIAYPYTEILQVYTLFFLFFPLILVFLHQGKWKMILAISFALYLLYWVSPSAANIPLLAKSNNFINFSAAQFLLVIGLLVGYAPMDKNVFLYRPIPRGWLITAAVGFIATLVVYILIRNPLFAANFGLTEEHLRWISKAGFSKVHLGPFRLLSFFSVFTVLFYLVTKFWNVINRFLGWLLLPLGRHSLYAYVVHLPLMLVVAGVMQAFQIPGNNRWINTLIGFVALAISWWFTRKQWLMPKPEAKKIWYLVPVVASVLFVAIETIYRLPGVYTTVREWISGIQVLLGAG